MILKRNNSFAIVGLPGSGKTSISAALGKLFPENTHVIMEVSESRIFQAQCKVDPQSFAFLNQLDFFLHKASWETRKHSVAISNDNQIEIMDTSVDQDYFVFSTYFYEQGWLSEREFAILTSAYEQFRCKWQGSNLIVLHTPIDLLKQRIIERCKDHELATVNSLERLMELFNDFLKHMHDRICLNVDTSMPLVSVDDSATHLYQYINSIRG